MRKTVLVTGASGGIGRAIAIALATSGITPILHYHTNERDVLETADCVRSVCSDPVIFKCDVTDRSQTLHSIKRLLADHGAPWGIVCNAGVHRDGPFPGLSEEDWDIVIDTNLDGFFNIVHPLVMPLIQRRDGGRIITISSVSGIIGNRGQVNYSAAKAGLIGATKALSKELAKRRITVNCIAPGFIETKMLSDFETDEIKKLVPMRRAGKPEEVAALVKFLFSDLAEYITGQVISINGGIV